VAPPHLADAQTDPHVALPERPSVATHAWTVAPGWVELEAGLEHVTEGCFSDVTLPLALKIGLSRTSQLTVSASVSRPADRGPTSIDEMTAGVKWRVRERAPIVGAIAVLPSVTFPTAAEGAPDGTATGVLLITSRTIGAAELDLNIGYTHRGGDAPQAPRHEALWAVSLGGPLAGRFGWGAELSGSPRTSGAAGREAAVNSLVSMTAMVRPWFGLDVALLLPIAGPDSAMILGGAVWNVGPIWSRR
jgi:hypothetical protein